MKEDYSHLQKYEYLFQEHLTTIDHFQSIILNGHLIVERALDNIIAVMLFHPEHIQKARLEFNQKVQIARGYALRKNTNGIWALILSIGEVRNEFAHNLTDAREHKKMDQLRRLYFREAPERKEQFAEASDKDIAALACGMCLGFLGTLEEDNRHLRKIIDAIDIKLNPELEHVTSKK
jgi:hypothetical protein